jgi:hypothetical protein
MRRWQFAQTMDQRWYWRRFNNDGTHTDSSRMFAGESTALRMRSTTAICLRTAVNQFSCRLTGEKRQPDPTGRELLLWISHNLIVSARSAPSPLQGFLPRSRLLV